ncbi:cobalamin-binding protein [Thalassotalea fusca]
MFHKFIIKLLLLIAFVPVVTVQANAPLAATEDKATTSVKRIVVLAPHIVEMLYEIDAGDLIVGTTDHSDYPEAALAIPRIGNYAKLNIEHVLSLAPDVVLAWKSGNPSDDVEKLRQLGLKIIYSQPDALEDVAKELRLFGELVGHQQKAEKVAKAFENELARLRQRYQGKKPVSAFYELWSRPLTSVAGEAWPQQQLSVCGIDNPFIHSATDYPQLNIEQVVLAAPQIIIQPGAHGDNAPDAVNWRQWPEIPAVEHNAFLHPDPDKMHRMTSRSLLELAKLCADIDQLRKTYYE